MKSIPHKTDFTFIYLGVKYRAKTIDVGWSYADIKIYKYTEPKWYSMIYDPTRLIITEGALDRKMYYDAESLLEFIKYQLDKHIEKELKKKLERAQIDIQLSFDEIDEL